MYVDVICMGMYVYMYVRISKEGGAAAYGRVCFLMQLSYSVLHTVCECVYIRGYLYMYVYVHIYMYTHNIYI